MGLGTDDMGPLFRASCGDKGAIGPGGTDSKFTRTEACFPRRLFDAGGESWDG